MVRPVQDDCAGARSTRGGIKRQVQDRKAKRRRESTHSVSIQHPQHSHDADLQKWKTGRSDSWRATKRGDRGADWRTTVKAHHVKPSTISFGSCMKLLTQPQQ